jgi:hypothetical protein
MQVETGIAHLPLCTDTKLLVGVRALDAGDCVMLFSFSCSNFCRLSCAKPGGTALEVLSTDSSSGLADERDLSI